MNFILFGISIISLEVSRVVRWAKKRVSQKLIDEYSDL